MVHRRLVLDGPGRHFRRVRLAQTTGQLVRLGEIADRAQVGRYFRGFPLPPVERLLSARYALPPKIDTAAGDNRLQIGEYQRGNG